MTLRIALAALIAAGLALAVVSAGVEIVSRHLFEQLMESYGASSEAAGQMFQQTVGEVMVGAVLVGAIAAVLGAILLATRLTRPVTALRHAAGKVASGDYSARVPAGGVEELDALTRAFNAMAESLERQEQVRRDFVAGAAHELLTPLTNLVGYLEGLRDGVVPATPELFASLHEEAERLVRLSQALLTLAEEAARHEGMKTPMDVGRAVSAAAALGRPALERRGMVLDLDVAPRLRARADPDHVTQALFNLLQNAGRYGAEGGTVRISACAESGMVKVAVHNSGPTIPESDLPRLFERFYRVDKSRDRVGGGAGLGLAIVKQVVESMGGQVGARSGDGHTEVWFSLPAA